MLSHVLRTITRHGLLGGNSETKVLCAVSGGPDSMALLACLWELAPRLRLKLEVATVDHGLRTQAATEMALVAARASDLGLPWHALPVDVKAARLPRASAGDGAGRNSAPGGVQEVARRLRLAALSELAERLKCGVVALGHNADDQAETILFRIVRGTGIKGLAGIPYHRPPFIRPLLDITRAQILAYLARRSLPFVTDPSNADLHYARARFRHEILPLLRRENPRVDRALRSLAAQAASRLGGTDQPSAAIGLGGGTLSLTGYVPAEVLAEIEAAASDGKGTRSFDVAGGRRITVSYGRVTVSRARPEAVEARVGNIGARNTSIQPMGGGEMTNVHGAGTYPTLLGDLLVREGSDLRPPNPDGPPSLEWSWFDAEQLSWPLTIRTRKAGDRMLPRGGAGRRKLSDLLIDAKIPRPERDRLPVVTTAAGELLFVPGLRPSQTAAPSDRTTRRIGLAVLPKPDHDALVDRSIAKGNTRTRTYHRHGSVESGRKNRGAAGTSNDERTSGCSGERGDLLVAIDERNSRAPGT